MNTLRLKRRITTLAGVPCLPASVVLFFDPGRNEAEVRQEIAGDARAAAAVVREDQAWHGSPLSFEKAWERLGPGGGRAAVLLDTLRGLFPVAGARGLDAAAAHRHAQQAARIAVGLVRLGPASEIVLAPAAAALHDVGRFVLDAVTDTGYPGDSLQHARGLGLLEAERREIGVEHTLAGKWLCEAWRLPAEFAYAAWLHHHPPQTLSAASYPLPLIDTVSLANQLARAAEASSQSPLDRLDEAGQRRLERLGLEASEVGRVLAELSGDVALPAETSARTEPAQDGPPSAELHRVRREAEQYRALHDLNTGVLPGTSVDDILDLVVTVLRETFGIGAGFCYAETGPETGRLCRLWRPGAGEPERIRIGLPGEKDGEDEHARQVHALLDRLPVGPNGGGDSALSALVWRGGLVGIPILAEGRHYGQIVFEADTPGLRLDNACLSALNAFAHACGVAIGRAAFEARLGREAEEMGVALWQRELAHAQNVRRECMSGIGRMAAGAAHEINNPLAIISGRAQILLSRAGGAEEQRALEAIIQQSRRAGKILTDLMQFARRTEPRLETVSIASLLRKVLASMRDRFEEKGIQLVEDFAQDVPRVHVDHRQMEQVFVNIVLNAEQAMPEGGVLTVRTRALSGNRTLAVQVSDTGPGIEGDVLDRAFEPFFTTRGDAEHTGLGLAVCHGIIENHHGTISLHGTPGEGTTCTITLSAAATPAVPEPEAAAEPPGVPGPPDDAEGGGGEEGVFTVLVAEEDDALREIVVQTLRRQGYTVHEAEDALEAVAGVLAHDIGLALLAHPLAAIEGQPPLRFLRERHPGLPIIAMAAPGSTEAVREALDFGANRCLQKPFSIEQLLNQVRVYRRSEDVA